MSSLTDGPTQIGPSGPWDCLLPTPSFGILASSCCTLYPFHFSPSCIFHLASSILHLPSSIFHLPSSIIPLPSSIIPLPLPLPLPLPPSTRMPVAGFLSIFVQHNDLMSLRYIISTCFKAPRFKSRGGLIRNWYALIFHVNNIIYIILLYYTIIP